MSGKLFVVGTPIGNLGDFSERAKETLGNVDFIAAEDTRVTVKLLNHFGIKKPMISYFEHNRLSREGVILDRILSGENCALVTDAGTPAISDPGTGLVKLCHESGVEVLSVPGPSAIVTAAAASGMDVSRFAFEGFLTVNKPGRKERLEELKNEKRTMIFYEAPHKLLATLSDFLNTFGDRKVTLAKELTKIHESVEVTTLKKAYEEYKDVKIKGEYVIILEGKKEEERVFNLDYAVRLARELIKKGETKSAASKNAAIKTGFKKSEIYKVLIDED